MTTYAAAQRLVTEAAQIVALAAKQSISTLQSTVAGYVGTSGTLDTALDNRYIKSLGGVYQSKVNTNGTPQDSVLASEFATIAAFGAGVLQLPSGIIDVSGNIDPPTMITLRGQGMNKTTIRVTGVGRGIRIINTPNVILEDFTVDMNKAVNLDGGSVSTQQGIYVFASNSTGSPGTKIRRVRTKNSWRRGIDVRATTLTTNPLDVIIEDCESQDNGTNLTGTGAYGIYCESLTNAVVRRCTVERNGGYGILVSGCAKAAVDDNFVDDHKNNHGIVVNNYTADFTCCRNRIFRSVTGDGSGQTQWGIVLGVGATQFVLADNLCDGNEGGITVDVAILGDLTIFVNTLGVVSNNTCINSLRSNAGLNVNHVDGLAIIGNHVAYNTPVGTTYASTSGISITGRNCMVLGNIVHHNKKRGIEFLESGQGCGPHYYGENYIYSNNQAGASWTDYYSASLTNGSVIDATSVPVPAAPQEDVFTVSGTWTKPTGAVRHRVICQAPGGGAGSGRRGLTTAIRCGGGGASSGMIATADFLASQLGATETVTVGTPGTGGAAVTVDATDGNAGTAGTTSSFGLSSNRWVSALAGLGGSGGTATTGAGASAAAPGAASGSSASTTGLVGPSGNLTTGKATLISAGGGGAGGGLTAANVESAGGGGSLAVSGSNTPATGGNAGGGAGGVGTNARQPGLGAGGGAGGGSSASGVGGDGGAGGLYGGGGGGGGASSNGNNSGKGGDGGAGYVKIITYFS